jgi:hypothetical protein
MNRDEIFFNKSVEIFHNIKLNNPYASVDSINQLLTYLDVFSELLRLHYSSLNKCIRGNESTFFTMISQMIRSPENKYVSVIKYYYTCLASRSTQSLTLPDHPAGYPRWLPFTVKIKRLFFRRFGERRKSFLSFSNSLLYNRRCAPDLPQSFKNEAGKEYEISLTRPSSSEDVLLPSEILETCVKRVFPNCHISVQSYASVSNYCLSTSSAETVHGSDPQFMSYEKDTIPAPFFAYGLIPSEVHGRATLLSEPLKIRTICTCSPQEFYAGKPLQVILANSMKRSDVLCFGRDVQESDIEKLIDDSRSYYSSNLENRETLYFLSGDYKNATGFISPYVSKILDRAIFKTLGDFNIPVNSEEMLPAFKKIWSYCQDENVGSQKRRWINLNVYFSCVAKSYRTVPVSEIRNSLFLNRKIKVGHMGTETFDDLKCEISEWLKNPESGDKICDGGVITQTNEQLMGDIKSFPLLCLLNYALWFETNNRIGSPPCLVNGDDFLAYAPKSVIDIWMELTKKFSFQLSVGKTYVSKDTAVINSTMFFMKEKISQIFPHRLNLVFRLPRDRPIGPILDRVIIDQPNHYSLINLAIKYNKRTISEMSLCSKINWFLPPSLGGLGIPGYCKNITRLQKQIIYLRTKVKRTNNYKEGWSLNRCLPPLFLSQEHVVNPNIRKYKKDPLNPTFLDPLKKDYIPRNLIKLKAPKEYRSFLLRRHHKNFFQERDLPNKFQFWDKFHVQYGSLYVKINKRVVKDCKDYVNHPISSLTDNLDTESKLHIIGERFLNSIEKSINKNVNNERFAKCEGFSQKEKFEERKEKEQQRYSNIIIE